MWFDIAAISGNICNLATCYEIMWQRILVTLFFWWLFCEEPVKF